MHELFWASIKKHFYYLLFLVLTLGSYFSIVFYKILSLKPDGIYSGHEYVWSDWALHIAIANIFAFKSPEYWFSYHPLYASGKFTYPFFADFIPGMFMRMGASLKYSFFLPSVISILFLLVGLYFLFYILTNSKKASLVSVFIFFLSAGLGFVSFLKDFARDPSLSSFLYPLKDFGRYEVYQWYSSNMVVGLLIPQRAFLTGVTLAVWSLIGVLYVTLKDGDLAKNVKTRILIVSGFLAGILPITHPHIFVALIVLAGLLCLFNLEKWRILWPFVLIAGAISSLLYLVFLHGGIEIDSFAQWHPGFTANGDFFDWLRMWILIWGTMLPLALWGLYYFRKKIDQSRWAIYLGTIALFVIGNLFYIQPMVVWNNSKIFWWVYLILSAPTSMALVYIWSKKKLVFKAMAVFLFITLTFMGGLELTKLIQIGKHQNLMTNTDDIKLGIEIRNNTGPLDLFLTAPSHNHLVMVWGLRPILMGYWVWVWSYGFDYSSKEIDIKKIFLGGDETDNLIRKYKISYVVVGPSEIHDLNANESYFKMYFPLAFQNNNYRIYDTRALLIDMH